MLPFTPSSRMGEAFAGPGFISGQILVIYGTRTLLPEFLVWTLTTINSCLGFGRWFPGLTCSHTLKTVLGCGPSSLR